jgi:hypothetical protein
MNSAALIKQERQDDLRRAGVDSASNRNEYQVYFLGLKAAGA